MCKWNLRLGQGRIGIRCKTKTPTISPIAQAVDKPLKIPKVPKTQDKVMTVPNFTMTPKDSIGYTGNSSTVLWLTERQYRIELVQIPIYQDPGYEAPPKGEKLSIPKFQENYWYINPKLTMDFKDNSPFQEGIVSDT